MMRNESTLQAAASGPADTECELCHAPGGVLLWEDDFCRVVRVDDSDYPGFCRVVLKAHVREMTDLDAAQQLRLLTVVLATERVLRTLYAPDKINLASLGNLTPHLHWHVIPRWRDDRHFPQPVWGTPQRVNSASRPDLPNRTLAAALATELAGARLG